MCEQLAVSQSPLQILYGCSSQELPVTQTHCLLPSTCHRLLWRGLPCTYLAHHQPESLKIITVVVVVCRHLLMCYRVQAGHAVEAGRCKGPAQNPKLGPAAPRPPQQEERQPAGKSLACDGASCALLSA